MINKKQVIFLGKQLLKFMVMLILALLGFGAGIQILRFNLDSALGVLFKALLGGGFIISSIVGYFVFLLELIDETKTKNYGKD